MLVLVLLAVGLVLGLYGCHHWYNRRVQRMRKGKGITLLMPFRSTDEFRLRVFEWVLKYYQCHLPGAEIIIGHDDHTPFSKTTAFNDAASRAKNRNDIFVLIDADAYIDTDIILECAQNIRKARRQGKRLWYIPYRHFYRLTQRASEIVLRHNPCDNYIYDEKPPQIAIDGDVSSESHGHWWGALIQIMPREAFEMVGGMDPRFHGWGGEDVAFMRAVDTLYARHKTLNRFVLHLWHPFIKTDWKLRKWEGQGSAKENEILANRYYAAFMDPRRMRNLVSEYQ